MSYRCFAVNESEPCGNIIHISFGRYYHILLITNSSQPANTLLFSIPSAPMTKTKADKWALHLHPACAPRTDKNARTSSGAQNYTLWVCVCDSMWALLTVKVLLGKFYKCHPANLRWPVIDPCAYSCKCRRENRQNSACAALIQRSAPVSSRQAAVN